MVGASSRALMEGKGGTEKLDTAVIPASSRMIKIFYFLFFLGLMQSGTWLALLGSLTWERKEISTGRIHKISPNSISKDWHPSWKKLKPSSYRKCQSG